MSDPEQSYRIQSQRALKVTLALLLFTTALTTLVLSWSWRSQQKERQKATTQVALGPSIATPDVSSNDPLPKRRARPVDLFRHYNAALTNAWHFRSGRGSATLRALPQGLQEFGGVPFDVRGIVQLAGVRTGRNPSWPEQVTDIPVGTRCRGLHFLHATGWMTHDGTPIGAYWVRYADGSAIEIPIVYGEHLREWHGRSDRQAEIKAGQLAWQDGNPGTKHRLFQCRWENPRPQTEVRTIDFVSAMTDCFPFLIAITAE